MQAKVTWQENMAFTGTADSGFNVQLDANKKVGGEGRGFIPMELMAISLAGCTAMDVMSILRKKRQVVTNFEVRVNAPRAGEHPRRRSIRRLSKLAHWQPQKQMMHSCVPDNHSFYNLLALCSANLAQLGYHSI